MSDTSTIRNSSTSAALSDATIRGLIYTDEDVSDHWISVEIRIQAYNEAGQPITNSELQLLHNSIYLRRELHRESRFTDLIESIDFDFESHQIDINNGPDSDITGSWMTIYLSGSPPRTFTAREMKQNCSIFDNNELNRHYQRPFWSDPVIVLAVVESERHPGAWKRYSELVLGGLNKVN